MFCSKLVYNNLTIFSNNDKPKILKFFSEKYKHFKSFVRDLDTFIFHIKISRSIRIFTLYNASPIGEITLQDVSDGFDRFIRHNDIQVPDTSNLSMYL